MLLNKEKKKLLEPHTIYIYIYIKGIKSVIFFKSSQQHRVNSNHKINNHSNREGGKKRRKKIHSQLQNKPKYKNNNKIFFDISAVSILSLTVSHSLPPPP